MSRNLLRPQAEDDSGVLQTAVGIEQLGAHRADIGLDRQGDHRLQPVRFDDHDVVVDEGEQPRVRPPGGGVVQRREVERRVDGQDPHPRGRGQGLEQLQRFRRSAAVVDHADLQRRVICLLQETHDTGLQQAWPIAGRDDGQDRRRRLGHRPLDDQVTARTGLRRDDHA